jgi:peptidyl-prolyl isomerase D
MAEVKSRQRCYLDISIDKRFVGRVVIELFNDITPKTCENFRVFCTGEKGKTQDEKHDLHFKGSPFHRIIKGFMIQGGDFIRGNGQGGCSIYGPEFEDENFQLKHDAPFLLSMANHGVNTNASQFFITVAPTPHLDGKHVVFGKVIKGQDVITECENVEVDTDNQHKPKTPVIISECGALAEGEDDGVQTDPADIYPTLPETSSVDFSNISAVLDVVESIRQLGNKSFEKSDHRKALNMYIKALRYIQTASKKRNLPADEKAKLKKAELPCRSNKAACHLQLKDYDAAAKECNVVLKEEPENVKVLFRLAQAQSNMKDFDAALENLKKCNILDPSNKPVIAFFESTKKKREIYNEHRQKKMSAMFG